ncbi:hypothetical protein GCK32_011619 [Trichostrongylus colubriformis]|uniref:Receptor ligand binding region domain-containing protein n=1 Tax=Trichostrongylus colubriformis TaxID=6319 RepID=A0AAN8FCS9_TRICO
MTIAYRRLLLAYNNETFKNALQAIKEVSRVTVSCFEDDAARRNFMVSIAEAGMDTDQYVWIQVESRKTGFVQKIPACARFKAVQQVLSRRSDIGSETRPFLLIPAELFPLVCLRLPHPIVANM